MKIFFVGKNIPVLEMLSEKTTTEDDEVFFYGFNFSEGIFHLEHLEEDLSTKEIIPDLIVCDYILVEYCSIVLFQLMRKLDLTIPLIFYNDPFGEENRVIRWLGNNNKRIGLYDFDNMIPFFDKLDLAVDSSEIKPFIEFFQSIKEIQNFELSKIKDKELEVFRDKFNLSPINTKLFSIFYKNKNRSLSLSEISQKLSVSSKKKISETSVYSYISRLNSVSDDFKIVRTSKGFYKLSI